MHARSNSREDTTEDSAGDESVNDSVADSDTGNESEEEESASSKSSEGEEEVDESRSVEEEGESDESEDVEVDESDNGGDDIPLESCDKASQSERKAEPSNPVNEDAEDSTSRRQKRKASITAGVTQIKKTKLWEEVGEDLFILVGEGAHEDHNGTSQTKASGKVKGKGVEVSAGKHGMMGYDEVVIRRDGGRKEIDRLAKKVSLLEQQLKSANIHIRRLERQVEGVGNMLTEVKQIIAESVVEVRSAPRR